MLPVPNEIHPAEAILVLVIFLGVVVFAYKDSQMDHLRNQLKIQEEEHEDFKLEGFLKGQMVQCKGVSGFYWDCKEED